MIAAARESTDAPDQFGSNTSSPSAEPNLKSHLHAIAKQATDIIPKQSQPLEVICFTFHAKDKYDLT